MAEPGVVHETIQASEIKIDPKEKFYRHFQHEVTAIQEQIDQLESFSPIAGERQDAIDHLLASISSLSAQVADAADYVPAYDQRTYAQAIRALTDKLNETTARLAPRARFQFKPRAAAAAAGPAAASIDARLLTGDATGDAAPTASAGTAVDDADADALGPLPSFPSKNYNEEMARPGQGHAVRKPSFSAARDIDISGQTGLHIILPASASRATSAGRLTDLEGCIVDMSAPTGRGDGAPFAGLHLKDIRRSLIVAGHVEGATHITGVKDSIVVVAARQVRIHECKNVDLYLFCGSHPIIEDCTGMRFAPIPACYMPSKEDVEKNQWNQVDDFKWLKVEHSPNWRVLPEEKRIAEEVWTKDVPGGPLIGVDDILKKVGVGGR